jgi:hypothetical protein
MGLSYTRTKGGKEFILAVPKGKDISIMIWGAIYLGGRSDLFLMERDPESKRQGYSANNYLAVLKDQIPRIWQPGLIFVQNNAPIHTAGKIKKWLENKGITTFVGFMACGSGSGPWTWAAGSSPWAGLGRLFPLGPRYKPMWPAPRPNIM